MKNKRRYLESRVHTIGIYLKESKCDNKKTPIAELSNICKVQSALSLTEIAKLTGIAKATLCRWFDQKERTSEEAEFEQLPQEYRALQDEVHRLGEEKAELGGRCAIAEDAMGDMERSVNVLMARCEEAEALGWRREETIRLQEQEIANMRELTAKLESDVAHANHDRGEAGTEHHSPQRRRCGNHIRRD